MENQLLIQNYLDKNYEIKSFRFLGKHSHASEWGTAIAYMISKIFSIDEEFCLAEVKSWAFKNGLEETEWTLAYGPYKLKSKLAYSKIDDLKRLGVTTAEEQIVNLAIYEIGSEIKADVLKKLKGKLKTKEELISIVKCFGYDVTPTIYDPITYAPYNAFVSTNYHEIINERAINPHWKDWIRTREQDKETC